MGVGKRRIASTCPASNDFLPRGARHSLPMRVEAPRSQAPWVRGTREDKLGARGVQQLELDGLGLDEEAAAQGRARRVVPKDIPNDQLGILGPWLVG